ncbi:hypothetical protein C1H46_041191 [Malus baccata]|uniref:Uncharacterized protein n=1 Tax=Malus baccata TaxID=106549 RepID=A0A540KGB8_MALBA|nr:hypothetical protein C1H46_041191 [Malus baccata]
METARVNFLVESSIGDSKKGHSDDAERVTEQVLWICCTISDSLENEEEQGSKRLMVVRQASKRDPGRRLWIAVLI